MGRHGLRQAGSAVLAAGAQEDAGGGEPSRQEKTGAHVHLSREIIYTTKRRQVSPIWRPFLSLTCSRASPDPPRTGNPKDLQPPEAPHHYSRSFPLTPHWRLLSLRPRLGDWHTSQPPLMIHVSRCPTPVPLSCPASVRVHPDLRWPLLSVCGGCRSQIPVPRRASDP